MTIATDRAPTWFGQPRGLTILFLTNMWEQFSYYGMRALLVYYMIKELHFTPAHASLVYGTYTGCAYFTPILGGLVADRLIGRRRAVIIGGSVMALGHLTMSLEALFYPALAIIALGNGLFLPSLPSQIDDLYTRDDPRRGWAYNVYYVGINIGGFLAPLICGTVGELYGWHYGFGAAGIGMMMGLAIYVAGARHLPAAPPRMVADPKAGFRLSRRTVRLLVVVLVAVTLFRGAYEQLGNTVALWIDASVDRRVGSMVIPTTWFQSLNPLLVMLLTPALLAWWKKQADTGKSPPALHRMATGAVIVAGAYLILAAIVAISDEPLSWAWVLIFLSTLTLGELFILPAGLALFARAAPAGLGATTVAAWYFGIFTGSLFAGLVGTLWSRLAPATYFSVLIFLALTAAAILHFATSLERGIGDRKSASKV